MTPPITLPATEMTRLAALVTELGQSPRSSSLISEHRAAFLSHHGHVDPGYLASVLVDEVAFAACLRTSPAARLGQPTGVRGQRPGREDLCRARRAVGL